MTTISKTPGNLAVIEITGRIGKYIGEILQNNPLKIKVEESGPFSKLISGDFIIKENDTLILQSDEEQGIQKFLLQEEKAGRRVAAGLSRFGIEDRKLHFIYSSEKAQERIEGSK